MSLWRVSRTMSANYGYLDAFCRMAESGSNKKQSKIGRASPGLLTQDADTRTWGAGKELEIKIRRGFPSAR